MTSTARDMNSATSHTASGSAAAAGSSSAGDERCVSTACSDDEKESGADARYERLHAPFEQLEYHGYAAHPLVGKSSSSPLNQEAVEYIDAEKGLPILFEFDVGAIDRGCPLSSLSQFPGEDEILIPPFSYLEVTGAPFSMDTKKGVVTVYPARINCNLKARTIDEIQSSRRDELLAQHPYLVAEFKRDVPAVKEMLEEKNMGILSGKWELGGILEAGRRQLDDLGKTLRVKEVAWYLLYCLRVCPRPTPSFLSVGLCRLAVCVAVCSDV